MNLVYILHVEHLGIAQGLGCNVFTGLPGVSSTAHLYTVTLVVSVFIVYTANGITILLYFLYCHVPFAHALR